MIFTVGEKAPDKRYEWHEWFAWHPVCYPDFRTNFVGGGRQYVWGEKVLRRLVYDDGYMATSETWWEYELIEKPRRRDSLP